LFELKNPPKQEPDPLSPIVPKVMLWDTKEFKDWADRQEHRQKLAERNEMIMKTLKLPPNPI